MNKLSMMSKIKEVYASGGNILKYFDELQDCRSAEDIMISYDFQAGTYVERFHQNEKWSYSRVKRLTDYIIDNKISGRILEAGVGEATTLVPLAKELYSASNEYYSFDISWSRLKVAKKFIEEQQIQNINLCTGDLLNIPYADSAFDLVYTRQAIEPNKNKVKEILQELYRVCGEYLILIEPAYELASPEAQSRMIEYGYVTNIYETARSLGYNVLQYELYGINANDLNNEQWNFISCK